MGSRTPPQGWRSTLNAFGVLVGEYPGHVAASAGAQVLVGLTEGIGVAALLPLLSLVSGPGGGGDATGIGHMIAEGFEIIGLPMNLGTVLTVIVAAVVLRSVFTIAAMAQVGFARARVSADLRHRMLWGEVRARWSHFTVLPPGRLAAAVTSEAARTGDMYVSLAKMIADVVRVGIHIGIAFAISWPVTIGALLVGGLTAVILARLVTLSRQVGGRQTSLLASITSRMVDGIGGMKAVKAMGREARLGRILEEEVRDLKDAERWQVILTQTVRSVQEPIMIGALALGLYLILDQWTGKLDVLLVLALLYARSVQGINNLHKNYQNAASKDPSFWFVRGLARDAEEAEEITTGGRQPHFVNAIEFEAVRFGYSQTPVLRDVSFTVPHGSFVAVTGQSGAGKTTIADLIIGLHRPDAGSISVDGVQLHELDIAKWRHMIGYVPQEMFLFHDSIAANVTLGDSTFPETDIEDALHRAGAWGFVDGLLDGPATIVGERGSKLSGGQRQRIAIARALLRRPELLILDEATTALDPETEQAICQTLANIAGEVTVLAISHQPALVEAADIVYRVEGGQVRSLSGAIGLNHVHAAESS